MIKKFVLEICNALSNTPHHGHHQETFFFPSKNQKFGFLKKVKRNLFSLCLIQLQNIISYFLFLSFSLKPEKRIRKVFYFIKGERKVGDDAIFVA